MKKTIGNRIFYMNIITIASALLLVGIAFNITINIYFGSQVTAQLKSIGTQVQSAFSKQISSASSPQDRSQLLKTLLRLDRNFDKTLSIVDAELFFIDRKKGVISPFDESDKQRIDSMNTLKDKIDAAAGKALPRRRYVTARVSGISYAAISLPAPKNDLGITHIVVYSSLSKIGQLKKIINISLLAILFITALVIITISSYTTKRISKPLTAICNHLRSLSERKFGTNISIPADNEILDLVNNVNSLSAKLESYDQSQKKFFQNASHELRTPLMTIQGYAEGLKYGVLEDKESAFNIIIDESKRLCRLVEDLLYLSRLDNAEEAYHFEKIDLTELITSVAEKMKILAAKDNIIIAVSQSCGKAEINADEEKMARAIQNIISNCIRYAGKLIEINVSCTSQTSSSSSSVQSFLELTVADDGPGFEQKDLENLFTRFYKGKKGNFGLGLAIVKVIIEKHNGSIEAKNTDNGGAFFKILLPLC